MNRRAFITASLAAASVQSAGAADASSADEQAHSEIWRRFIDKHGIMIDFADMDGRMMNKDWKPQQTEQEAEDLAHVQLRNYLKVAPRRAKETEFVREPTAAAWVVTLAPDAAILKQRTVDVERVIAHYDYAKLYYSQFFWVEGAWWRLQDARQ